MGLLFDVVWTGTFWAEYSDTTAGRAKLLCYVEVG
jgi:hypothetical protein